MDPNISAVINGARCFQRCIPAGMEWPVANYLVFLIAAGGTAPPIDQLANNAACFNSCIPPGFQLAFTNWLLNLFLNNGPPTEGNPIITEDGAEITTEGGDILVLE